MKINMITLRMVEQEKGVSLGHLVEAIEEALLEAYHNIPGVVSKARIEIDQKTGRVAVMAMDKGENGDEIGELDDTPKNLGRVTQSIARSIIMQHLCDADDQKVLDGFANQKGQVVAGVVDQSRDGRITIIRVGDNFEAILPDSEKVPGEAYHHDDRIRAFVVNVERTEKSARITLSRTHPGPVAGLFEREIPEIRQGLMKIEVIAHEASHRTKIVVVAAREGVDAKGVCIGPMGLRVRAAMTELNGEKIDIVNWSADPGRFIANALSPARVSCVVVHSIDNRTATAIVPDFQLPLAISKEGQNARLAARLANFHIDIHSDTETGDKGVASHSSMPDDATSRSYSDPQD